VISARLVVRASRAIVRALLAMHPRAFRRSFGPAILAEIDDDLKAAASGGALTATGAAVDAIRDALRALAAEWSDSLISTRRAMLNALVSDLRHAVRTLARDRGFTAVAVGTLGVGLALCAVVTVLVNAYLVRGLPYPASHRLFDVRYATPGMPSPRDLEKLDWRALDDVVEVQIAWDLDNFSLRGAPYPELAQGTWVTPGYVEGFRVQPALGRPFAAADFETGRPNVAIISHALWQRRFNGDPAILGRTFDAYVSDRPGEAETFTIIGVLPAGHWHLNPFTEVLAPLRAPTFPYVVRLTPGVAVESVSERITSMIRRNDPSLPEAWHVELRSTQASYVQQLKPLLLAVATATALVLLIAYANVGVLLTVRAAARRREIALRQAIGASAVQITRAIIAEPIVLGMVATVAGLGLAWITIAAIAPSLDHYLGRGVPGGSAGLTLDAPTLAATAAAGALAVFICAVIPLVVARRTPVSLVLTAGQTWSTETRAQRRARGGLAAVEIAACLTLLVGAVLTIQSAVSILRVDMGLDADNVLVGRFALRQRAYPDAASRAAFYERALPAAAARTS
jgi:putative ABC transport system permease protein